LEPAEKTCVYLAMALPTDAEPMTFCMTRDQIRRRRRQTLLATAAALAALLILHNPSAGYQKTTIHYEPWPMPPSASESGAVNAPYPCDPPTEEDRKAAASQRQFLGEAQGQCRSMPLDFFRWRSRGALLDYVATMRKLLAIGGAILFAGLAWIWILGDPKLRRTDEAADSSSAAGSDLR
jgi:hypothetical protein